MQVSHESPMALLELSRTYNDYDYCLVHLLPQFPKYLEFFQQSKLMSRKVLLDNSMFELREAFEASKFAEWINVLKPDEYIVPDVFSDADKTIANFMSWQKEFASVPGKRIGVIQGSNFQDLIRCYEFMKENADKIAISFECSYFHTIGYALERNATVWHKLMSGRKRFIKDLIRNGFWDWNKPHHLLGCALPQEFKTYNLTWEVDNIESIDTSNPVIAGMHNILYTDRGLEDKLPAKLADMLEDSVSEEQQKHIMFNIKKFREINSLPIK